jgi:hypothetical protein
MPISEPKPLPPLSADDIEIFWWKVDKRGAEECWPWIGYRQKYGRFWISGKFFPAHRIAYVLHYGKDPTPLLVCHRCDNPWCCNWRHLFSGTTQENTADRDRKGRTARGERSGAYTHPECVLRHEANPRSKLTVRQVREIRESYALKLLSQYQLASKFHVSRAAIAFIVRGKSWRGI